MADYQPGQWVQVNVEGLVDLGEWAGAVAGLNARVTAVNPITKLVTVVFDAPMGGQHTVTVPPSRVRPTN